MAEKELGCRLSTFWSKSGFGLYANSCSSCRGWGLLSWEEISSGPSETRLWLTITISGMSSAGNNDDTIEAVFIFFSNKRQDWDHFAGLSKTRFLHILSSKGFPVKDTTLKSDAVLLETWYFCRYYWTDFEVVLKKFLYCCCEADKVEESRKVEKKEKLQWNCLDRATQRWKKKSLLLSLFCVLFVTLLSKFISVAWKVLQRL